MFSSIQAYVGGWNVGGNKFHPINYSDLRLSIERCTTILQLEGLIRRNKKEVDEVVVWICSGGLDL